MAAGRAPATLTTLVSDILTRVNLADNPSPSHDRSHIPRSEAARYRAGKHGGLCAGDIEERVHLSQPTISHHMAILTKAGLVEAAKQGQWRWYKRNDKALRRLVKSLRAQL